MTSLLRTFLAAACTLGGSAVVHAQASLSAASHRPFVVGVIPVVGRNGGVGGVAVDAQGAIAQADPRHVAELRNVRRAALDGRAVDVAQPSKLRKISLRRLDALLAEHAGRNLPLPPDVLYLAGLQRVEYLFAYPDRRDIVLAGPADAWTVDDAGQVVSQTSGAAVLQLVDLIAALRSTDALLAGEPISCSIDPTPLGLQRLARITRGGRAAPSVLLLKQMEEAVGPQAITLTGISPQTHFAQILVAADWQMKRLAMGLDRAPVEGLASYLELLQDHSGVAPQNAMPRWWIAYGRAAVHRDREGLGWLLTPPGLEVRTAAVHFNADGRVAADVPSDPLAKQWAADMTARYDELAIVRPVFAQLRGCMDLALVTAVLASGDLRAHVGVELPMLFDQRRLQLASHPVPKTVASTANALRRGREWMVTFSGGVDLDVAAPVNAAAVQSKVEEARTQSAPIDGGPWWWD